MLNERRVVVRTEDTTNVDGATDDRVTFACPFYKFDPVRYRSCLFQFVSTRTNDVKQHILCDHQQRLHCPQCGELMKTQSHKNRHIHARSCEPRAFTLEGVTRFQREQIAENPRSWSPLERWYRVWDIIFPTVPRPPSPYVKDPWIEVVEAHQRISKENQLPSFSGRDVATSESNSANPFWYFPVDDEGKGLKGAEAEGSARSCDSGYWSGKGGITNRPSTGSYVHSPEGPAVQTLTPGTGNRVGGIESFLNGEDAIFSEAGHDSRQDSGDASRESGDKPAEVSDDVDSNYSAETTPAALTDGYITSFASRLAHDIDNHPFLSIPDERLKEWVKLFSLKLHGEAFTSMQRTASVFLRKERRYISKYRFAPLSVLGSL